MNAIDAIKEIGRGRNSARPLSREQACAVFAGMLAGTTAPLQVGALLMAWRIKGETADELAGFLDAVHATMTPIEPDDARPLVVIPSYNGARTRPNLLPLLALLLRAAGARVLIHGVLTDPKRVTTAQVLAHLGVTPCATAAGVAARLQQDNLAFIGIDTLAPQLARLLDLRWQLGVRGSGHTVVKMLDPVPSAALRLVSVTHPEYMTAMREFYQRHPSAVALMRGTEGEAVVRTARPQAIEYLQAGTMQTLLAADDTDPPAGEPALPDAPDAEATARWIDDAMSERVAMPVSIRDQADALMQAMRRR